MREKAIFIGWVLLAAVVAVNCWASWPYDQAASGYPPGVLESVAPDPARLALAAGDEGMILMRTALFDPLRDGAPSFSGFGDDGRAPQPLDYYLVQFAKDLGADEWSAAEGAGARFVDYIPNHAYLVRADAAGVKYLGEHPGFRWMELFRGGYKVAPGLLAAGWEQPVVLDLRLFPGENPFGLLERLQEFDSEAAYVDLHGEDGTGLTLRLFIGSKSLPGFLAAAAVEPGVWSIDPYFLPRVHNDNSIWVVQSYDTAARTTYATSATIWNHGISGTGQTPAVADTGCDSDMCYFRNDGNASSVTDSQSPALPGTGTIDPAKKVIAYYVEPGATAYDGNTTCGTSAEWWHGTHTTCTVLGHDYNYAFPPTSTTQNHGSGMAPNAKLIFQDIGSETTGCLDGLQADNYLIYQQAYNAGARIHSNSWGGSTAGVYTSDCQLVDRFLYDHENFQLFYSNGNDGSSGNTVGSPATAKNCVSVGATVNGSSGANSIAYYSSRGPTDDDRRKPDVCTPGSTVLSASGDTSHTSNNCGTKTGDGTSMACPTTAGAATLLRQYFADGFYPTGAANAANALLPSAALLKAALVNGAVDISATTQATVLNSLDPNNNQGWGRVLLDTVCFFSTPSRDARRTRVWDKWNATGLSTGQQDEYTLQVAAGQPFKVTLVWTDPQSSTLAAKNLVNNLDLEVESPARALYLGNVFTGGQSATGGTADAKNNVEEVFLTAPTAGAWTIRVKATAVPGHPAQPYSGKQGYALVATYADCTNTLTAPASLTATSNGTTGIDLSWPAVTGATIYQVYRATGNCSAAAGDFRYVGKTSGTAYADTTVQGGYAYAYKVRAADACSEGPLSPCATATYGGRCTMYPTFGGLTAATNDTATGACDVLLTWSGGTATCPGATGVVYNVYRGSAPVFPYDASTRIATGLSSTSYRDTAVMPGTTYFYVVRAEDSTTLSGGPANGGNEDTNRVVRFATPTSGTYANGTWSDAGGDNQKAYLVLDPAWSVSNMQNHTGGGSYCYRSALEGDTPTPMTCASATTPDIPLQAGQAPSLSYWVRYNLEYQYDGIVVEISTNGGGAWTVLTPTGGYPSTFALTQSPPINACAYTTTQGCFTGPSGNAALTAWTQYTHNLSSYAGQTVRVRWRLSTDPGTEFEGFYLDDIEITFASVPNACAVSNGFVTLDGTVYNCASDVVGITVVDNDLSGGVDVGIASDTEPGGETVHLTETSPGSGQFTGSITTTAAAPAADGLLSLADGNTITVTYVDANDGQGGTNVPKTDTAAADCLGPVITNVQAINVTHNAATITWDTNESANSRVTYGTSAPPGTNKDDLAVYVTAHSVQLTGLASCTTYYFSVTSADAAGNTATANNGGIWYSFRTGVNSAPTYTKTETPPLAIPDNNTTGATSTIVVSDSKVIQDVNVRVHITHTYDGDITLYLIGPDLTSVTLSARHGSSGDNYTDTVFDDEAATAITSGTPPYAGTFRPDAALTAFDGKNALGNWGLKVVDSASIDTGTIDNWSITFTFPAEMCLPGETAGTPETAMKWTAGSKTALEWGVNPDAATYNLYRGVQADLGAVVTPSTDSCTRYQGAPVTATGLAEDPSALNPATQGIFYWYLVTATNAMGEGSEGNATSGPREVNSSGACL